MSPPYRTALVTGASSGIGRQLALRLAQKGAHVVAIARRREELFALAEEAKATSATGRIEPLVLDVSDCAATVAAVRAADERLGGLDLVVANAGVGARPGVPSWSWEAMADACHINFCGGAATLTAALPAMVARRRGHLVGISSLSSFGSLPQAESYCSPKAGLSMLLDCLRLDLKASGIAVTAVHLGFVRTPMLARSTHPMPQLKEIDTTVEVILARLKKRPAAIDYPQPLAFLTRMFIRIPRRLRDYLLTRKTY